MKIYLAGPQLSAINASTAAANLALFERVTALLRADGHDVYGHHEQDERDEDVYTEQELTDLTRDRLALGFSHICRVADAVIAVPGWRDARRGRAEVATALALHLPVYDATSFLFIGTKAERIK